MDRGAWRATVHRVTKNRTQLKRLSTDAPVYWVIRAKKQSFLALIYTSLGLMYTSLDPFKSPGR